MELMDVMSVEKTADYLENKKIELLDLMKAD
jgi:hypothetical protein